MPQADGRQLVSNPSQPATGTWSAEELIAAVEAGPKGPHIGALFDFDGTLIDGYSLSAFARHHLRSVREFAGEHGIDLAQSYAYSNGDEDVPFLRTSGRARAINPGRRLAEEARHYGWPVARFRSRRAGIADIAHTAAGLAGMLGGFT